MDAGLSLDLAQRPAQPAEREDLVSFVVSQDVAHAGGGPQGPRQRQRLGRSVVVAGFQVSISGRFWVSTEVEDEDQA
jgi:hypothetical protein